MKHTRHMISLALGLGLLFCLSPLGLAAKRPPLQTPAKLDLQRFMGKWYEIAYTPNIFEKQCIANTTDEYELLSPRLIKVINRCETENKPYKAEGRAKVLDNSGAKQRTTFLKLWGLGWVYFNLGDYWITAIDPDYTSFIGAQPSRKYGWILARTPSLPTERLRELAQKLKAQGYNPCQFMTTVQTGGLTTKKPLCEVTR